ncbi:MAG: hypothetical protein HZB55_06755 [Deltaproteobacteria bacterium]|nr:hypothetical protein [Deltaproteobacteria bacterium]
MASPSMRAYRRRNFFVKHWFQVGFALYPILFLAVFLAAGSLYLERQVRETLEFHLYLPHSRLANPWDVVGPAVLRVAVAGGGAFVLALAAWVWRRFARLHRDLSGLAAWLAVVVGGRTGVVLPALRDVEVRLLGVGLEKAARDFEDWDGAVAARVDGLCADVSAARAAGPAELPERLAAVRDRWRALVGDLSRLRVEEDLS